jgi:hypothetical protein
MTIRCCDYDMPHDHIKEVARLPFDIRIERDWDAISIWRLGHWALSIRLPSVMFSRNRGGR